MARIKVVGHDQSEGKLKEVYDDLVRTRGKLAEVHTIQSLRPASIVKHMELYMEIMFTKSDLSRAEREMIAVVVSANNNCEYCQIHHVEALNHYWRDEKKTNQLKVDYTKVKFSEREKALCKYAEIVTVDTLKVKNENVTSLLRDVGISDSGILDASLVVSYFNFVNRMVLSLGVSIEDAPGGYKY